MFTHMCVERNGSGVELRSLDYEYPGFNPVSVLKPWASFFTLETVVDICMSSLRTLIVAYGWLLPREAEMVSE